MKTITKLITARGTIFAVKGYSDDTLECTWAKFIVPSSSEYYEGPGAYDVYLFRSDDVIEVLDVVEIHRCSGED